MTTRNDVDVGVLDVLDREAVLNPMLKRPTARNGISRFRKLPDGTLLGDLQFVNRADVLRGTTSDVAVRDGVGVRERDRVIVLDPDAGGSIVQGGQSKPKIASAVR
jgi:hypothetical protein